MASLLLLVSPDDPDDSCNAVGPAMDVILTAVVYPGDSAVARISHTVYILGKTCTAFYFFELLVVVNVTL
jgi:hypothetical protein